MVALCKKGKQDGKLYSGEKSRKSPSPNEPTPRPTKKLEIKIIKQEDLLCIT